MGQNEFPAVVLYSLAGGYRSWGVLYYLGIISNNRWRWHGVFLPQGRKHWKASGTEKTGLIINFFNTEFMVLIWEMMI